MGFFRAPAQKGKTRRRRVLQASQDQIVVLPRNVSARFGSLPFPLANTGRGGAVQLSTRSHEMANGTVKWFNAQKGFGFIQPDNGGKDVFVHISAVEAAGLSGLNEGQKVSFEIANQRGRDAAANLKTL